MSDVCPVCGLPKELCICEQISQEQQKINIRSSSRKYGKVAIVVDGFDKKTDIKNIGKELKRQLACGGTVKNDTIELQAGKGRNMMQIDQQKKKIKEILIQMGYKDEQINLS
ncbi:MAG: stress response translation initiation inhibitor YciH [Candidatus Diapherotrites archaeon]|nr:stress response translation initiation inhibitor YciH [Candidatus Diapherotrites archaeon]